MPIAVQCSGCGGKFRASDDAAGRRVKCPKCSVEIAIPVSQRNQASQTGTPQATGLPTRPRQEAPSTTAVQVTKVTPTVNGSCPACGCADIKSVPPPGFALTFSSDKQCEACGTIWRPAWPKYGGVLAIVLGSILALFGIGALVNGLMGAGGAGGGRGDGGDSAAAAASGIMATGMIFGLALGALGTCFAFCGVGALTGKLGKQAIIKKAQPQPK